MEWMYGCARVCVCVYTNILCTCGVENKCQAFTNLYTHTYTHIIIRSKCDLEIWAYKNFNEFFSLLLCHRWFSICLLLVRSLICSLDCLFVSSFWLTTLRNGFNTSQSLRFSSFIFTICVVSSKNHTYTLFEILFRRILHLFCTNSLFSSCNSTVYVA